jgi:hypothetical protein
MAEAKSLGDAIQKLIDNVETVAEIAGNISRLQAEKDFNDAAKTAVDKYYEYKNGAYTKYGRQHNLYDIYKVNSDLKKRGKTFTITTNIDMNSAPLEGAYHSNSSKHQGGGSWESGGQVEGDYVFDNFLQGEHPWTYFKDGEYMYGETVDKEIPDDFLKDFIKNYGSRYFEDNFQKTIAQLLKVYL